MSILKYTAFLKTIEYNSLTKAAESLGYTQPGISHMILSLEDDLGLQLLIRRKDGVYPTKAAQALVYFMRQIVSNEARLREAVGQIRGIEIGSLRIGCYYSISVHWLPTLLSEYLTKHPNIDIAVCEGVHSEMSQWLLNGDVDLALMSYPAPANIDFIPLIEDPILAVLPNHHPLAENQVISVKDLVQSPFIVPLEGADEDVWQVLHAENCKPNIRFRIKGDKGIISMIAKNLGVSLMPQFVLDQLPDGVVARNLDRTHSRNLGLAIPAHTYASPAAQEWISLVKRLYMKES